ncbi:hypothetical protein [Glycomyces lechevalierae]|uniref:Uncharacterized protein n=1 Tax=Glycomyces lechevalierae TaxID=256034 RepID=A0ABU2AWJ8_9ACTN|nr:hypothetical protein [Glycomyces lechevalierae]MDR7341606.1 hypothetical protein [Glycomyces lechevalierae]
MATSPSVDRRGFAAAMVMSPACAAATTSAQVGGSPPVQPSSAAFESGTASTEEASPSTSGSAAATIPAVASEEPRYEAHAWESGTQAIGRGPRVFSSQLVLMPAWASRAETSRISAPMHCPVEASGWVASHSWAASSRVPNRLGATATVTR